MRRSSAPGLGLGGGLSACLAKGTAATLNPSLLKAHTTDSDVLIYIEIYSVEGRGYEHHIRGRVEEQVQSHPDGKARRWVVERAISWLKRSRRLLVRREKKKENYLAFVHLARIIHALAGDRGHRPYRTQRLPHEERYGEPSLYGKGRNVLCRHPPQVGSTRE